MQSHQLSVNGICFSLDGGAARLQALWWTLWKNQVCWSFGCDFIFFEWILKCYLKKYGLQFLQSWYRTNQSPICPLLKVFIKLVSFFFVRQCSEFSTSKRTWECIPDISLCRRHICFEQSCKADWTWSRQTCRSVGDHLESEIKGVKKWFLHDCAETVEEEGNRDRGKNCVPEQTS